MNFSAGQIDDSDISNESYSAEELSMPECLRAKSETLGTPVSLSTLKARVLDFVTTKYKDHSSEFNSAQLTTSVPVSEKSDSRFDVEFFFTQGKTLRPIVESELIRDDAMSDSSDSSSMVIIGENEYKEAVDNLNSIDNKNTTMSQSRPWLHSESKELKSPISPLGCDTGFLKPFSASTSMNDKSLESDIDSQSKSSQDFDNVISPPVITSVDALHAAAEWVLEKKRVVSSVNKQYATSESVDITAAPRVLALLVDKRLKLSEEKIDHNDIVSSDYGSDTPNELGSSSDVDSDSHDSNRPVPALGILGAALSSHSLNYGYGPHWASGIVESQIDSQQTNDNSNRFEDVTSVGDEFIRRFPAPAAVFTEKALRQLRTRGHLAAMWRALDEEGVGLYAMAESGSTTSSSSVSSNTAASKLRNSFLLDMSEEQADSVSSSTMSLVLNTNEASAPIGSPYEGSEGFVAFLDRVLPTSHMYDPTQWRARFGNRLGSPYDAGTVAKEVAKQNVFAAQDLTSNSPLGLPAATPAGWLLSVLGSSLASELQLAAIQKQLKNAVVVIGDSKERGVSTLSPSRTSIILGSEHGRSADESVYCNTFWIITNVTLVHPDRSLK